VTPEEAPRAFGWAIRERRRLLGLSQERLADECGLDRTYVSGIERGERNLSLRNIVIIARGLQVRPGHLLDRAEELSI
jgi:transcriptional regulator with XRE-family HTH domain